MEQNTIDIFTLGVCMAKSGHGPGIWTAILFDDEDEQVELFGVDPDTTEYRMELSAVIAALDSLERPSKVFVNSDSKYIGDWTREWLSDMKTQDWRSINGILVENHDLWKGLDAAIEQHQVEFI